MIEHMFLALLLGISIFGLMNVKNYVMAIIHVWMMISVLFYMVFAQKIVFVNIYNSGALLIFMVLASAFFIVGSIKIVKFYKNRAR